MLRASAGVTRRKSERKILSGIGTEFADLFAEQGWNLYAITRPIYTRDHLEEVIRLGRARPARECQRYALLPWTPRPNEPESVFAAFSSGRAGHPFFIDQYRQRVDGREKIVTRGIFLVDSVMLSRNHVWILVDIEAMFLHDIPIPRRILAMERPSIVFDVLDMYEKIPLIMNAVSYSDLAV